MNQPDGRIYIHKNEKGQLETDITGLLYLLRDKKIQPNSLVEAFLNKDFAIDGDILLDTYTVEETEFGNYILTREDDEEEYAIDLSFYLDTGDEEIDLTDMFDMGLPLNFELDEMTVAANYLIHPAEEIMNRHIHIIPFTEAISRIEKGGTVFLDFMSKDRFMPINSDDEITTDMLIEGVWGVSSNDDVTFEVDPKKVRKVNPFTDEFNDIQERMDQHLLEQIRPSDLSEKEKDELIDNLLTILHRKDIDKELDDDIIDL